MAAPFIHIMLLVALGWLFFSSELSAFEAEKYFTFQKRALFSVTSQVFFKNHLTSQDEKNRLLWGPNGNMDMVAPPSKQENSVNSEKLK